MNKKQLLIFFKSFSKNNFAILTLLTFRITKTKHLSIKKQTLFNKVVTFLIKNTMVIILIFNLF
ncbi:unnamed protein product [Moritella viscosa]|nr:unnamed protein product [Moritella viscosa]